MQPADPHQEGRGGWDVNVACECRRSRVIGSGQCLVLQLDVEGFAGTLWLIQAEDQCDLGVNTGPYKWLEGESSCVRV